MNNIDIDGESSSQANETHGSVYAPAGSNAGELIDRIHKLRILLPVFAREVADARREAGRLRSQNAKLRRRIAELERRFDAGR